MPTATDQRGGRLGDLNHVRRIVSIQPHRRPQVTLPAIPPLHQLQARYGSEMGGSRINRLLPAGHGPATEPADSIADIHLPRVPLYPPHENPLHLGHLAAQASSRREFVRVGRLVQGPPSGLDQKGASLSVSIRPTPAQFSRQKTRIFLSHELKGGEYHAASINTHHYRINNKISITKTSSGFALLTSKLRISFPFHQPVYKQHNKPKHR